MVRLKTTVSGLMSQLEHQDSWTGHYKGEPIASGGHISNVGRCSRSLDYYASRIKMSNINFLWRNIKKYLDETIKRKKL